jgi:tetratricopeptide (TPR) repeat protein
VDGRPVEEFAFRLAYRRLAGDARGFDQAVGELLKFADAQAMPDPGGDRFCCAKALLLNGRPVEAIDLLARSGHRPAAFELLCARDNFADAFALVEKARTAKDPELPRLEVLHARTLFHLGDREQGRRLFARLAAEIRPGQDFSWFEDLVEAEVRVGLVDEAAGHAASILASSSDNGWPGRLFRLLAPRQADAAEVWWALLSERHPLDPQAAMKEVRRLLDGKTPAAEVEALARALTERKQKEPPKAEDVCRWHQAAAEAAFAAGLEALGVAYLERADGPDAWLLLGDRHAARKDWERAAVAYRRAWEKDPRRPLPLYLHGDALARLGRAEEGAKARADAHWLPLGDELARNAFAAELRRRGFTEDGRREDALLLRVSQPAGFYQGEALRRQARDAERRGEFAAATAGQERSLLRCLRVWIRYEQSVDYLSVPAQVRRLRARALLADGKVEAALQEAGRVRELLPAELETAVVLVPELERRGHRKEADALFGECLARQQRFCRDHPRAPAAHNAIAWLCAACRRDLDEALTHARQAVALAPDTPGPLDTLAEVLFQRGEKAEAVTAARRVVELAPQRPYFRAQLRRIEAGNPAAPLPFAEDEDD